jgi:hypothetical protein
MTRSRFRSSFTPEHDGIDVFDHAQRDHQELLHHGAIGVSASRLDQNGAWQLEPWTVARGACELSTKRQVRVPRSIFAAGTAASVELHAPSDWTRPEPCLRHHHESLPGDVRFGPDRFDVSKGNGANSDLKRARVNLFDQRGQLRQITLGRDGPLTNSLDA